MAAANRHVSNESTASRCILAVITRTGLSTKRLKLVPATRGKLVPDSKLTSQQPLLQLQLARVPWIVPPPHTCHM